MNKKARKNNKDHSRTFDEYWLSTFEELGKKDLPPYRKASYETGQFFVKKRELFLRHLLKGLLINTGSLKKEFCFCLDLGCNTGGYTHLLHRHHLNVCGIDYAETPIREARGKWPQIPFLRANAYDIPFRDNSVDSVVSFGLLQCVSDQRQVLMEILRVLRSGGIGLVETIHDFKYPLIEKIMRHVICLMTGELTFFDLTRKFKARLRPSSSFSSSYAPSKQAVQGMVALLMDLEADEITIHDPTSLFIFHHFFWGLSFKKRITHETPIGSTGVTKCPICLRYGKWKRE